MSHKVVLTLTASLLLAAAGMGMILLSARQEAESQDELAAATLEQSRAIHELEIAVLEQGGLAAQYVLSGNQGQLDQLHQRESEVGQRLDRVRHAGLDPDQQAQVERIGEAVHAYATERNRAISAYQDGDPGAARELLTSRVYPAYEHTCQMCAELSTANDQAIEAAGRAQHEQVRPARRWAMASLTLAGLCIGGLIWLVFVRVLWPLRRMARDLSAAGAPGSGPPPRDELEAILLGLQNLRHGVAEARSRLERSNRHLLDAQQLASVGRLAAGVAHEIRSPLTALRLRLFSIQKALAGAPERRADLQVMSEEISRLESMVSSFLEFSRPPALNLQRCDVTLVLDKTLELLRYRLDAGRIQVKRDEPRDPSTIMADVQQLKQVFLNLLSNAIDVLPGGGTIHLSVHEEQREPDCPCMTVRITDNGPGIPPEAMPRIFDPFFTTKESGAGLGLWVAYRIVAEHKGSLELEHSLPGETTFTVRLPVPEPVLAGEGCHEHGSCR